MSDCRFTQLKLLGPVPLAVARANSANDIDVAIAKTAMIEVRIVFMN
jgi:hypothetical protein